jgi:hypothetical protein
MKKMAHHIGLICILTLSCVPALHAKDLAAYRVGDAAENDIVTPVALDVIDPAATAALKSAEATRTPVIFRICSDTTNALAREFLAEFAGARSNFIAAIQDTFHQATLDDKTIAAPDFGYLITAFNIKNKNFPVTVNLAATWARGDPGLAEQKRFLNFLMLTMQHPIRSDDLPDNFVMAEIVRLVPVNNINEELSLTDAETRGKLVTASSLTTLSQLRTIFHREFTGDDEQPLARALTALLKPNCLPDAGLTQLARDTAVRQIIVADHYDAGQVIVRQGATIDAKVKMAIDQMHEKIAALPSQPTVAGHADVREPALPLPSGNLAQNDATVPVQSHALSIHALNALLIVALIAVSFFTLLLLWRLISRLRDSQLHEQAVGKLTPQNPVVLHAGFAPHLAQVVKDALVQELAAQRRELLVMQQIATSEIVGLVQKLDEMQLTMQERVRTYEMQIKKLEQELAARTEENHELLKLKIGMIRQQLEVEGTHSRMEFN